jgi:hypothetical protein
MRKAIVLFIAVLFLLPAILSAQPEYATDKGSMLVGGSASFTSSGGDDVWGDDRFNELILDARIVHFIAQNFGIGGRFQFINQSYGNESQTYMMIGPTVIYYFGAPDKNILPFITASFLYGNLSDSYSQTVFGFGGGFTYMVARNIGFTTEAFYQFENYNPEGEGDSASGNTFGIAFGISAFIY